MELIFTESTHTYTLKTSVDGKKTFINLPSITQLIGANIQAYPEFLDLAKYAEDGKEEHKIFHELVSQKLEWLEYRENQKTWIEGMQIEIEKNWFDKGYELLLSEKPLYSGLPLFAGTPDAVFINRDKKQVHIVERKRSFVSERYHALQLAGQESLLQYSNLIPANYMVRYFVFFGMEHKLKEVPKTEIASRVFDAMVEKYWKEITIDSYLREVIEL